MSSTLQDFFGLGPIEAIPSNQQWPQLVDSEHPPYSPGPPLLVPSPPSTVTGTMGTGLIESIDFKTHNMTPLKPYVFSNPTVTISVWDSNERCWSPCRTDKMRLVLGNKKLRLERYARVKEVQEGGINPRYPISVASLQWKPKKTLIPAFLEMLDAPAKQTKKKVVTKYKPIFYFALPNGGELQRVREDETPPEAAEEALETLTSLYGIQEKILKQLSSSPQSVWIRLASSNRPTEQNGPVQILLGPNSPYQLVEISDLPFGGGPPFLWDSQSPDNIEQNEGEDMGVFLSSDGLAQKQEGLSAVNQAPRFSGGVEIGRKGGESDTRASRSVVAETGAPNNTRSSETPFTEARSAGTGSFYNTRMLEFSASVGTLGGEIPLDEEQTILARLTDIERELELLREKQVLTRKLRDIKARKTVNGNSPHNLFE